MIDQRVTLPRPLRRVGAGISTAMGAAMASGTALLIGAGRDGDAIEIAGRGWLMFWVGSAIGMLLSLRSTVRRLVIDDNGVQWHGYLRAKTATWQDVEAATIEDDRYNARLRLRTAHFAAVVALPQPSNRTMPSLTRVKRLLSSHGVEVKVDSFGSASSPATLLAKRLDVGRMPDNRPADATAIVTSISRSVKPVPLSRRGRVALWALGVGTFAIFSAAIVAWALFVSGKLIDPNRNPRPPSSFDPDNLPVISPLAPPYPSETIRRDSRTLIADATASRVLTACTEPLILPFGSGEIDYVLVDFDNGSAWDAVRTDDFNGLVEPGPTITDIAAASGMRTSGPLRTMDGAETLSIVGRSQVVLLDCND